MPSGEYKVGLIHTVGSTRGGVAWSGSGGTFQTPKRLSLSSAPCGSAMSPLTHSCRFVQRSY